MKNFIKNTSILLLGLVVTSPINTLAYSKTESVFTNLNNDGSETKKVVTSHICPKNKEEYIDNSNLDDIINLNGDEAFTKDKDTIKWKSNGKDIYYQGTTKETSPITFNINYYLNNKKKDVKDIINKKGSIKIEINMENNSSNEVKVNGRIANLYTPFLVLGGTMFNTKYDSNISISNGKIVETGNNAVAMALASPGLSQSLDLDKLDSLNKIVINYNTTKFKLNNIYFIATPKVLEEEDIKSFDEVNSLVDSVNLLQSSMDQLESGSKELSDGASKLNSGSKDLQNGIKNAYEGSKTLSSVLNENIKNLTNSDAISEDTLNSLNQSISQSYESKKDSIGAAASMQIEGNSSTIQDSATKTIENNKSVIESAAIASIKDSNEYKTLASQDASLKTLYANFGELCKTNEATANEMLKQYNLNCESLNTNLIKVETAMTTMEQVAPIVAYNTALSTAKETSVSTAKVVASEVAQSTAKEVMSSTAKEVASVVANQAKNQSIDSLKLLSTNIDKLTSGLDQINKGAKTLVDGTNNLNNGANKLTSGLDEFNNQGIKKLSSYADTINNYSSVGKALIDLSKNYKGYTSNNSDETIFISKVKSAK